MDCCSVSCWYLLHVACYINTLYIDEADNITWWWWHMLHSLEACSTSTLLKCLSSWYTLSSYKDFDNSAWVQFNWAYHRQAAILKELKCKINTTLHSYAVHKLEQRRCTCAFCITSNNRLDLAVVYCHTSHLHVHPSPRTNSTEKHHLTDFRGGSSFTTSQSEWPPAGLNTVSTSQDMQNYKWWHCSLYHAWDTTHNICLDTYCCTSTSP